MIDIRIQQDPFDPEAEQRALRTGQTRIGALVAFVGLMRDHNAGDDVRAMTLEHYPGMTERALAGIADEASARWSIDRLLIIHRVGKLLPEDPIVLVAVTSSHRGDAFRACEFLIDYLKARAPFWKKETLADGRERWVGARASDADAVAAWAGRQDE
jgi:molybdopterin synthase catalytic subunit